MYTDIIDTLSALMWIKQKSMKCIMCSSQRRGRDLYDIWSIVICVDNTSIKISRLLDVQHEKENFLFQEI